jgi:hypothetical protein
MSSKHKYSLQGPCLLIQRPLKFNYKYSSKIQLIFSYKLIQKYKLNQNVMYSMLCDILSKNAASHMNARATLLNGKTVKENSGRMGPFCIYHFQISFKTTNFVTLS